MYIELFPLEKAVVDGKVISLGMEKSVVEELLGTGEQFDNRSFYFESNFCIEYDQDEKVAFIEVTCDPNGLVTPIIYGADAAKSDAEQILQLLKEKNGGEIDDSENGYSYGFYQLSVGIYREMTPDDYNELVDEMKANGVPIENNPDLQADFWKATHWATIGIGIKNYYR